MITMSQQRTRRMVAIHGWSAVICGLFLYVVILTGSIAVLSYELGIWSAGGKRAAEPLALEIDPILRDLSTKVPEEYLDEVSAWGSSSGDLIAFLHTHKHNPAIGAVDDYGKLFEVDPNTGEVLESYEGFGTDVYTASPIGALDNFIVDLHVNLHAPNPWGLYATGILGFVMLVAAISGLLMHRHLIKDVFLAPRENNPLLSKKDRHVLAGTWSLLFSFVLGFTGAFYSFAGALGLPLVAVTAFGGDQVAMVETLVGAPQEEDKTPAAIANVDDMKALAISETGSMPTVISVGHWGRADSRVQMFHPPAKGDLSALVQIFNGVNGEYQGAKPSLGTQPSAGNTAFELMAPLHFGHFAGLFSKIVWVCLGLAACYVTASGMRLWLQRREDSKLWCQLGRSVDIVVYGTPIGLAGAAHFFFVSLSNGDPTTWTTNGFLIFSALSIVIGIGLAEHRVNRVLKYVLAASLITLPITRLVSGGTDWFSVLSNGYITVVGMDLLLIIAGFLCLLSVGSIRFTKKLALSRNPSAL